MSKNIQTSRTQPVGLTLLEQKLGRGAKAPEAGSCQNVVREELPLGGIAMRIMSFRQMRNVGVALSLSTAGLLAAGCTSQEADPSGPITVDMVEEGETPTAEATPELSPAEYNQEVLEEFRLGDYIPGTEIEPFVAEVMRQNGSAPQVITQRQEYLDIVRTENEEGYYEYPIEYLSQLGENFAPYVNLLQANRDDTTKLPLIQKAGAQDFIQNIPFSYNTLDSDTVDVSDDVVVRTLMAFVESLPPDAIAIKSEMSASRHSIKTLDNRGTWINVYIQYATGETEQFNIQISDLIPDVAESINDPYEPYDSSVWDDSQPLEVGFTYRPEVDAEPRNNF